VDWALNIMETLTVREFEEQYEANFLNPQKYPWPKIHFFGKQN
jgi:hypothetical protein